MGRSLAPISQGEVLMTDFDRPVNFRKIASSRKRARVGDVFAMLMPDGQYIFGRVIAVDADPGVGADFPVVYIYKSRSSEPSVPHPADMRLSNLLVPPMIVNMLGWSRGYLSTIGNVPLGHDDVPPRLCFFDPMREEYVDQRGEPLESMVEPVGMFGVGNYSVLDDEISKALHIPLASDV